MGDRRWLRSCAENIARNRCRNIKYDIECERIENNLRDRSLLRDQRIEESRERRKKNRKCCVNGSLVLFWCGRDIALLIIHTLNACDLRTNEDIDLSVSVWIWVADIGHLCTAVIELLAYHTP